MNTATQPTAVRRRNPMLRLPLRHPAVEELDGAFWAVHWMSDQLASEELEKKAVDRRHASSAAAIQFKKALWAGHFALRTEADRTLQTVIKVGGLLFCWEGSSVMHTPIPAAQP